MRTDLNTRIDLVTRAVRHRPSGEVNVTSLFLTDTLASQQYQEAARRKLRQEPEQELLFAVLKDAIYCFQRYASARDKIRTRLYLEARKWLWKEDDDWPFSFANICGAFGLSPQHIRAGLLRHQEVKFAMVAKGRIYQLTAGPSRTTHTIQTEISGGFPVES